MLVCGCSASVDGFESLMVWSVLKTGLVRCLLSCHLPAEALQLSAWGTVYSECPHFPQPRPLARSRGALVLHALRGLGVPQDHGRAGDGQGGELDARALLVVRPPLQLDPELAVAVLGGAGGGKSRVLGMHAAVAQPPPSAHHTNSLAGASACAGCPPPAARPHLRDLKPMSLHDGQRPVPQSIEESDFAAAAPGALHARSAHAWWVSGRVGGAWACRTGVAAHCKP